MAFVATTTLDRGGAQALADAITEVDSAFSGQSVDLHEAADGRWEVSVYFERKPDAAERAALADLSAAAGAGRPFRIAELPETDWVRRSLAELQPVRAGRFLVHGSHDRGRVLPSDLAIEIEAGLAFGTGHHGTTVGCLIAIDRLVRRRPIQNALDVGTGTGVLAISIAKRTKARVLATDIDPVAVAVAHANVRLNGATPLVTVAVADGLRAQIVRERAPYDLIVANILAGPLVALAPAIRRCLTPGGTVILSGLLVSQVRRVAAVYHGLGLRRTSPIVIGEWATLVLRRS